MQTPHYAIQVPNADLFLVKICSTRKSIDMCTGSVIKDKQGDIIELLETLLNTTLNQAFCMHFILQLEENYTEVFNT